MLGQNLNKVKNFLYEKDLNNLNKEGSPEKTLPLTQEEKQYMVEYMRQMEMHCNEMYGQPTKYEESAKQVNRIVDIAERLTTELSEAEDSKVDGIMVRREIKRLIDDAKLYEKSCNEAALAEARAKRCYEDMKYQMERLYGQ